MSTHSLQLLPRTVEVRGFHLARPQVADIDVPVRRRVTGAGIGRVADVITVRTGRIDSDPVGVWGAGQVVPEESLRRRRPANVSHADEKYIKFSMI